MKKLINHLIETNVLKNNQIIEAMTKTDRSHFAPYDPYSDRPQLIGHGATISAPHMHGYALEYLY